MKLSENEYQNYTAILRAELIPAMGCTEPIAIAYAAAIARDVLADEVKKVTVQASGNIIKNVKSVVVPNTGGRKGIAAAAAAGIVAGDAKASLEVIANVSEEQLCQIDAFLKRVPIDIEHVDSDSSLDISIIAASGLHTARVRIVREHCNVVLRERDGQCLYQGDDAVMSSQEDCYDALSMRGIYDFAVHADIEDVKAVLDRQISCNMAIAQEGLRQSYGASISSILLSTYGNNLQTRAKAMAAAGSDARMSGCELPVIILSGSGNQGMTASIPVIVYAQELNISRENLYRALLISNLMTVHQKLRIGRLSAYCGVVAAGAGAGAGIAYLLGCTYEQICAVFTNALAIPSGMICDGAKPSCAAKIATAVDAGIMGAQMVIRGKSFHSGEGIVCQNVEATIANVGRLASRGMKDTDEEIIQMMIEN